MNPAQNRKFAGAPAGLAVAFGRRQVSDPARSANTPHSTPSSVTWAKEDLSLGLAKEELRNQALDSIYPVKNDGRNVTRSLSRAVFFLSPVTRLRFFAGRRGYLLQSRIPRYPSSATHHALGPRNPQPASRINASRFTLHASRFNPST